MYQVERVGTNKIFIDEVTIDPIKLRYDYHKKS